jgi:hypothetical protein
MVVRIQAVLVEFDSSMDNEVEGEFFFLFACLIFSFEGNVLQVDY